jgi:hypothetical protein
MIHRWSILTPLLAGEIISSWLVRAAFAQGCDPLVLTGEIWPKWRVWTLDADRMVEKDRLLPLVQCSGISEADFVAATIHPTASRIYGENPPIHATWPWILALGTRNRKRRAGLQCCPACLKADQTPYFRLRWRYAWHTCCEEHECNLIDRCATCNAPFEPHRLSTEFRQVAICATCRSDIREMEVFKASDDVLEFQKQMDDVLQTSIGRFDQNLIPLPEWFKAIHFLTGLLRRSRRSRCRGLTRFPSLVGIEFGDDETEFEESAFEMLPLKTRQNLLGNTWKIFGMAAAQLTNALHASEMTRQMFCPGGIRLPSVFKPVYEALRDNPLPDSRKRRKESTGNPRSPYLVRKMMGKLRRELEMTSR